MLLTWLVNCSETNATGKRTEHTSNEQIRRQRVWRNLLGDHFQLRNLGGLALAIIISYLPGLIGTVFTDTGDDSWYEQLEKPWFNPPGWVFGPVWSVLYIGMGVALYLIWRNRDRSAHWYALMAVFAVQLVLNGAWSLVFFGMETTLGGLIVIVPLWFTILVTILMTRRYSGIAALILIPYLLWVSFATVLNFELWRLN
jgi:translocator protein